MLVPVGRRTMVAIHAHRRDWPDRRVGQGADQPQYAAAAAHQADTVGQPGSRTAGKPRPPVRPEPLSGSSARVLVVAYRRGLRLEMLSSHRTLSVSVTAMFGTVGAVQPAGIHLLGAVVVCAWLADTRG